MQSGKWNRLQFSFAAAFKLKSTCSGECWQKTEIHSREDETVEIDIVYRHWSQKIKCVSVVTWNISYLVCTQTATPCSGYWTERDRLKKGAGCCECCAHPVLHGSVEATFQAQMYIVCIKRQGVIFVKGTAFYEWDKKKTYANVTMYEMQKPMEIFNLRKTIERSTKINGLFRWVTTIIFGDK